MKILVLAGLAESLVRFRGNLLTTLVQRGLKVHATAPNLSADQRTKNALCDMQCICHDVPIARTGINPIADVRALLALVRLMRREKPSHFLGYTVKPVVYGLLAARFAGVKHRVALITGLGSAFNIDAVGIHRLLQLIVKLLYKLALTRATLVMFQNPDDRDLFVRLGLVPRQRTALVNGSGVPLDEFPYRPPAPDDACHFILVGRLNRDKGIYEYMEAARRVKACYPRAVFHLVGWIDSNPTAIRQSDLEDWIREGLVVYHGRVSDVQSRLAASHVFVLPSCHGEGTPRAALEAMAVGRAVITTDAPGCRETVIDGENGFLVPVRDADALAQAMQRFLEDPGLSSRMGQRSRQIAEEKYDVNKVTAQMLRHMGLTEQDGVVIS
jgi:glycosyltransferase involved in cell wall biosynthesis